MKTLLKVSKALADETRLRILNILLSREFCVCELQDILSMSQPRISRHLRILKEAELINQRKKGKWNSFRPISSPSHTMLFEYLRYKFDRDSLFIEDRKISSDIKRACTI